MSKTIVTITDAELQDINSGIAAIKQLIDPHVIELTDAEKLSLPKMGDAHSTFVMKALTYAQQNPALTPNYIDANELKSEADVHQRIWSIYQPLKQICDKLNNTMTFAGSDAYVGALSFYSSVKDAAKRGVPGAQSILDDLGKHFNTKTKNTQPKNPTVQP